ncbi:hypothetical protein [Halanaerobium congolense]|uniref:DUF4351 domain-containing protein n=2 Tax=Halanaerobium congolense TaxID=54121 RepID=A0A1G6NDX6_9FIRM|nr:hypothetical protein [Halanaerobium congolense]TDS32228.1 hypothetical protein BY453_10821 [Halanaerobium congolense]SDC65556.1 hypothetical protein SAMN04488597_11135 [Halanaerobium congolense]SDK66563.1 hypothetical protein SAMN04515655_11058 [Halanaerobium congolense]SDM33229.1 hypothetical protein SAMN04488599_10958 [Halanaerobium congolense]
MQEFDVTAHNYDFVFKDSFNLFKNDIADFLEVELPGIASYLETEFAEIETNLELLDLNFMLKDGSILHLEEEAEISISDLIRFASYDLKLYNRYRDRVRTIILCIKGYTDSTAGFNCGSLGYNSTVVDMSKKDGKKKLVELKTKIENKEKINYLDLIFLPLMNSDQKIVDRVKETIKLEEKLEIEQNSKNNLVALTVVLSDKFLSDKDMSEIWRDYKMVKFFKYVEEQGKKEGEKQGEKKLFKKLIKGNFEGCDDKIMELIDQAEISKLEELSERISKIKDLKELEEALKH